VGALSGTLTSTAFYVDGDPPEGFRDAYLEALGKHRFKEIDYALEQDESIGWVSITDPFDTDFDLNKILWGSYLMVSLRHDVVRLPAAAFRLHLAKAIAERLEATGRERLTKAEQEDVRDELEKQLRKRVLPAIKTFDLVWNLERKELWFFTQNKKMNERFVDIFDATFGLALRERNPYSLVEQMGLDDETFERLFRIEPAAMAAPPR